MEFKKVPSSCYPAYAWAWTTKVDKAGIKQRIDEMYEQGIRAFYILSEPKEFRPETMHSALEPDYLSDAFMDLVYYAYEYATEKGMHTWFYNEGGWPSGMACGQVIKANPALQKKDVYTRIITLEANEPYIPGVNAISAFIGDKRVKQGSTFPQTVELKEYYYDVATGEGDFINSDIGKRKTVEKFLELTHEKYKKRFGSAFGTGVRYAFDDEILMGSWTEGFEDIFLARYGYDIRDYMEHIFNRPAWKQVTDNEKNAFMDWKECRDYLTRENYLRPMREWLNANGMYSGGHLRGEQWTLNLYYNILSVLREYDVPGVDAIWGQITYPNEAGKSVYVEGGYEFFPRLAHSAARHQGLNLALTESMGVYGAQTDAELMRFVVNFQAVRGINLFNFNVASYAKEGDGMLPLVYRCNFIKDNPSRDCLSQINNYTARLVHILQQGKPVIDTALYHPCRTANTWCKGCDESIADYERLGHELEEKGVAFDIIDEEFVKDAEIKDGTLCGKFVAYKNVFTPLGESEPQAVKDKLALLKAEYNPVCERKFAKTQARHLVFEDNSEAFFVVNTDGKTVQETLGFACEKTPYRIDLETGELYAIKYERQGEKCYIDRTLLRGEGVMICFTDEKQTPKRETELAPYVELKDFTSFISRRYEIDENTGIKNTYYDNGEDLGGLGEWNYDFSGEVTYKTVLPALPETAVLDLGEVRNAAKVYVNGKKIAEATMPPYRVALTGAKTGDELKIVVANTAANAIRISKFFDHQEKKHLGPYHKRTLELEKTAPAGGLIGPVTIMTEK